MKYTNARIFTIDITENLLARLNRDYFSYDDQEVSTDPNRLTAEELELVKSTLDELGEEMPAALFETYSKIA